MRRATLGMLVCAAVGWLLSAVPVFAQQMAEVFAKDHPTKRPPRPRDPVQLAAIQAPSGSWCGPSR